MSIPRPLLPAFGPPMASRPFVPHSPWPVVAWRGAHVHGEYDEIRSCRRRKCYCTLFFQPLHHLVRVRIVHAGGALARAQREY
eukprot:2870314-Pleurochrysis_carterae.AAC.1